MHRFILYILCLTYIGAEAQTLGGNAVFHFISMPNTAQTSALGGINISDINKDVGMSFHNPSMLKDDMHQQVNTSFHSFLAGIRNYSLTSAYHLESLNSNMAIGINYFDYGTLTQTDAAGNILGSFRPVDYVVQWMASRKYHEKLRYGLTMKYIQSNYGQYRSSGLAFDLGLSYYDSLHQWQASVVVKNMGTQLTTYDGNSRKAELPFDIQAGITKRLENAPFQFSLTAHQLQAFNTYYNDTTFRAAEGENGYANNSTLQKIFSHIVISAKVFLGSQMEIYSGYNFQRRQDLNGYNISSGLNGFSLGTGFFLKKFHIRYATGFYQSNTYHQFSLNLNWNGRGM